jgi:hypothetical protein
MTTLTTAQQTEVEKPVTRVVYFAEFHFKTATQYLSSLNQTITWGGRDWIGLGALANINTVEEADSVDAKSLDFTLNVAETSILALAVGSVEEYRGLPAKLYMCPLSENFTLVDTPVLCWTGIMDTMAVGVDADGAGQITLRCETAAYALKRRPSFRMNAAQQKIKYPNDTGFDYLTDLIARPQLWLSKNFQRV